VTWTHQAADIAAIFAAVAAAIAVTSAFGSWWRGGPGRRRTWIRSFHKLAPAVLPGYVEQLFGQPMFAYTHPAKLIGLGDKGKPEWFDKSLRLVSGGSEPTAI
jgi:hypothetical protein